MYVQCVGHFRIVLSVVYEAPIFLMVMLTRGFKLTVFEFSSFTPLPLYRRIDSHQKNHGCEIMLNILV